MSEKQSQKAGAGSTQIIAEHVTVDRFDEDRVREIARVQAERSVAERFQQEAAVVAHARITRADKKIIAKLTANELLDSFCDPAFVSQFQKAQICAAQTDEEGDYELLANLLLERALDHTRAVRATVARAVDIIDLIDEAALNALTALWAIVSLQANTPNPQVAINTLDEMYTALIPSDLPHGRAWVSHLDLLNSAHHDGLHTYKPFCKTISSDYPNFVGRGYNIEERQHATAEIQKLIEIPIPEQLFQPHPYKADYFRLYSRTTSDVINIFQVHSGISESSLEAIKTITDRGNEPDEECLQKFSDSLRQRSSILNAEAWFDQLGQAVTITPVGRALAYVNAKRRHPLNGVPAFADYVSQE